MAACCVPGASLVPLFPQSRFLNPPCRSPCLGQLLHFGRELNAMNQVVGIMFVIVVIGLLSDKILFSPLERFLHRRWGTGQA